MNCSVCGANLRINSIKNGKCIVCNNSLSVPYDYYDYEYISIDIKKDHLKEAKACYSCFGYKSQAEHYFHNYARLWFSRKRNAKIHDSLAKLQFSFENCYKEYLNYLNNYDRKACFVFLFAVVFSLFIFAFSVLLFFSSLMYFGIVTIALSILFFVFSYKIYINVLKISEKKFTPILDELSLQVIKKCLLARDIIKKYNKKR